MFSLWILILRTNIEFVFKHSLVNEDRQYSGSRPKYPFIVWAACLSCFVHFSATWKPKDLNQLINIHFRWLNVINILLVWTGIWCLLIALNPCATCWQWWTRRSCRCLWMALRTSSDWGNRRLNRTEQASTLIALSSKRLTVRLRSRRHRGPTDQMILAATGVTVCTI